jgi:putative spermidine/putrescine transport system ATP-binding protein
MGQAVHLSIRNVRKNYGEFVALHATSIDIQKGEFFSIIGPSGSGKTTLLGAMAGFNPPSSGEILLSGTDIVNLAPYRRDIGMVFQNYSLFPHMTVAENIAFPLKMRRFTRTDIDQKVRRMLATVKLEDRANRKPSELSGGQQQRVALARAAVYDPALLLMDEPLGALDKNLRSEMQFEIKQFQRVLGATVVYVTHDQEEAAAMSHRIAVMNHGRVEQVGTAQTLYEHPENRFVASFIGEANIFSIRSIACERGLLQIETKEGPTLWSADSGIIDPQFVCIRPEVITIGPGAGESENKSEGQIIDSVHGTGTLRYVVRVSQSLDIVVRSPCSRGETMYSVGSMVQLGWRARDTSLVRSEAK